MSIFRSKTVDTSCKEQDHSTRWDAEKCFLQITWRFTFGCGEGGLPVVSEKGQHVQRVLDVLHQLSTFSEDLREKCNTINTESDIMCERATQSETNRIMATNR